MEQPELPSWLEPQRSDLQAYADLLATVGVDHGLIGPREVPRLWSRHLLNSAVVADPEAGLVSADAAVADVGSGAGLPGLVWALARPDLRVTLIEPLLRRANFLQEAIVTLGVSDRVLVLRDRGEEAKALWGSFDVVTARAVAPLAKLLGWTIPLLKPGGRLLALKGQQAVEELQEAREVIAGLKLREVAVIQVGSPWVDPATTVVSAYRGAAQ
ncbi:MAG TPA: 16S rRNA (guanine(527)-N(7))-methyltransferase RsmG [Actinobacteria bacterium]|nr:16S rRNA (guanine(527)-N(7))-methyltransferase RsmG [Actinomycetota bacterium]